MLQMTSYSQRILLSLYPITNSGLYHICLSAKETWFWLTAGLQARVWRVTSKTFSNSLNEEETKGGLLPKSWCVLTSFQSLRRLFPALTDETHVTPRLVSMDTSLENFPSWPRLLRVSTASSTWRIWTKTKANPAFNSSDETVTVLEIIFFVDVLT